MEGREGEYEGEGGGGKVRGESGGGRVWGGMMRVKNVCVRVKRKLSDKR